MTTTYQRKTTRKKKPMTEQPSIPNNTITKVQSHLPNHYLIDRNALWDDFKTRMKINNVEVSKAMEDLKTVVNQTHKVLLPYVDKAVNKVKELRSQ